MNNLRPAFLLASLICVGCESNGNTRWSQEVRTISVETDPPGAQIWQIVMPSGSRVDLGMTPLVKQQVPVLTKYHGSFSDMASAQRMMSSMNLVRLHIEKAGFEPHDMTMTPAPNEVMERKVVLERTVQPTTKPADQAKE